MVNQFKLKENGEHRNVKERILKVFNLGDKYCYYKIRHRKEKEKEKERERCGLPQRDVSTLNIQEEDKQKYLASHENFHVIVIYFADMFRSNMMSWVPEMLFLRAQQMLLVSIDHRVVAGIS
jgi:hypothetical protein